MPTITPVTQASSPKKRARRAGEGEEKDKTENGAGELDEAEELETVEEEEQQVQPDLSAPECFLNRELTWLSFNERVLHEAADERTPLLERAKFLSIVGSNLDEFFMKRIGGLKQQVGARVLKTTVDGRSPEEQIDECYARIRAGRLRERETLRALLPALQEEGIHLLNYEDLDEEQREELRDRYLRSIFPLVTPQAMDPAHPFPFVSNLSLNLLVTLHLPEDDVPSLARVKVPTGAGIPRFIRVGSGDTFVPLEQVMANNLDLLFPGMEAETCELFRVTRNANTETDEEQAEDLLAMIESELRERRFAPIVRLEVGANMSDVHRGMLAAELGLDEESDVFERVGMMGRRDLMEIARLPHPHLQDKPHVPLNHPNLITVRNVNHVIRTEGSLLLHHPYDSFASSVERFLREASRDEKVRAIKMTLYRTSEDSRIIQDLIDAARNGKQVAVVVELKARFDEEANIRWANHLEQAGIHVTYGVVGLKTHCKVILVVRQDYDGLRRYAHIGTGNYHSGTARQYSDLGLLTCDDAIGQDCTELFNYLTTGYKPRRSYNKLLVAPKLLKPAILGFIKEEIEHQEAGRGGRIRIKTNAIEDADISRALYQASMAGVEVDLVVRDSCRVRPGVPGLSDNIRVVSIVGRFLEHTRILHFGNAGEDRYYFGSADMMQRNLESRVEVHAPVEDPKHQAYLDHLLNLQLTDQRSAWEMDGDGCYRQRRPENDKPSVTCQEALIELHSERHKEATRLKKRKTKGLAKRRNRL